MRRLVTAAALAAAIICSGCATVTEAGYFWGNYAQTLYKHTKTPSDETLGAHVQEMERVLDESKKRGLKAPPGIHAELGYIKAQQGATDVAMAHYRSEMELYPESRLFLERLTATPPKKGNEP